MAGDKSICDLDLLMHASQAVYRIVAPKTIEDKNATSIPDVTKTIEAKNYNIYGTISPGEFQENSHVCALALEPIDDKAPIVIAFRGTKTQRDMGSNASITVRGVAGKNLCEEAYQFYQKIKDKFPGKEIVLTGHSLGGHLAQYVAAKAYANKHEKLFVRTFNSAPINTTHGTKLKTSELNNFVNFRFSKDVLGKLPFKACYGDIYVFKSGAEEGEVGLSRLEKMKKRHSLKRFYTALPKEIRNLQVGSSSSMGYEEAVAIEKMKITQASNVRYDQRKWFEKYRVGRNNLQFFNEHLPKLNALIDKVKKNQSNVVQQRIEFRETLRSILGGSADTLKELAGYAVHVKDKKALQKLADDIEQLYMHLVDQNLHQSGVLSPKQAKKLFSELNEIRLTMPKLRREIAFEGRGGTAEERTCLSSMLSYAIYMIRGVLDLFTQCFTWLFMGETISDKNSLAEHTLGRSFVFQKKWTQKEEHKITKKLEELLIVGRKIGENLVNLKQYDDYNKRNAVVMPASKPNK